MFKPKRLVIICYVDVCHNWGPGDDPGATEVPGVEADEWPSRLLSLLGGVMFCGCYADNGDLLKLKLALVPANGYSMAHTAGAKTRLFISRGLFSVAEMSMILHTHYL